MCVDNYYINMLLVSLDNRMLATKEKEREREREREVEAFDKYNMKYK